MRITNKSIRAACAKLDTVQNGVRSRTLSRDDVLCVVALYRAGRGLARRTSVDPDSVEAIVEAEGVPNSYRYRAKATRITVDASGITVGRFPARKAPRGAPKKAEFSVDAPAGVKTVELSRVAGFSVRLYAGRAIYS